MRQQFYAWLIKGIMPDEYKWPLEIYICGLAEFKKLYGKLLSPALDKLAATLEDRIENCFSELLYPQ